MEGGGQEWFSFHSLFPWCLTALGNPQLGVLDSPGGQGVQAVQAGPYLTLGHPPWPILQARLGPTSDRGHRQAGPPFCIPRERR